MAVNKTAHNSANPHDNHRERMRQKLNDAPSSLSDHEIVEMLLYGAIKRGNTNEQAHALLNAAGGRLCGILELDNSKICSIDGLGKSSALLIRLLEEFYVRVEKSKLDTQNSKKITRSNIYQKLHKIFFGMKEEMMIMITVDNECRIINQHTISKGSSNATVIPVNKLVREALADNAAYVFLAHNHPNGILAPSKEDEEATVLICQALALVEIPVLEHYIVTSSSILGMLHDKQNPLELKL